MDSKHTVEPAGDITLLLERAAGGDEEAHDALVRRVYGDLEKVAARRLYERFGAGAQALTIEPAALVNETFLKLLRKPKHYENRRHFFAYATRVMLRTLADYQRARSAAKRGGGQVRVTLVDVGAGEGRLEPGLDSIGASLEELEELDPRKAEVVVLKVFWGMDVAEIADALSVSERTVARDWRFARNWLRTRLESA
jgi:RNA polymerase sigma factor (TIGR02999 family)